MLFYYEIKQFFPKILFCPTIFHDCVNISYLLHSLMISKEHYTIVLNHIFSITYLDIGDVNFCTTKTGLVTGSYHIYLAQSNFNML